MNDIRKRNNISVLGNGSRTVMLSHGFGCDQHVWERMVEPLLAQDATLVLFDHVGSGQSDLSAYRSQKYSSLEGYAADVVEICQELELKDVVFVGHSVSSIVGLLATSQAPEYFSRLIMVGPSPRYINDEGYVGGFEKTDIENLLGAMANNYLGWAQAMAPVIMGQTGNPALAQELERNFCATDPEIAREFASVTFFGDNRPDLPRAKVPNLTLQCTDDAIAPFEVGYYIQKHTPQNSMTILKATGHCPHMSAHEETLEAMKAYLNW